MRNLLIGVAVLVVGYLVFAWFGKRAGRHFKQFMKLRSIAQRVLIGVGIGMIGWVFATLHLCLFDRLFLRLGRLRRR